MTALRTPRRVLMTADTVGGVWTYALELTRALAPVGVEVTLATMGAPVSPGQARVAGRLANLDLVESRYALEWMREPWRDVDAAGEWLLELARGCRADLVHLNGYAHAVLPFGVPVLVVAHSCVSTWFQAVRGTSPPEDEWGEYRRRVAAGLSAAELVVAPTAAILAAVLAAHGVRARGRVIWNGRDAAAWRPAPRKEPFVLSAGRLWDEGKGLGTLVAAAPRVPWPVAVAGPAVAPGGERPVSIPGDNLLRLGELSPDSLAEIMGRASIYAHPARYEPFGLAVVEAALSGCALVLGDRDTLRELWGDAACYVPPGDPDALAFALMTLIADDKGRRLLAAKARVQALAMSPERMATAYRATYDDLCTGAERAQEATA